MRHEVVCLDEHCATPEVRTPSLDHPQDTEQLTPVDGAPLLCPGEPQHFLLDLATYEDQLSCAPA
jgi:hypothetical protein